jgi:hypothetical protein
MILLLALLLGQTVTVTLKPNTPFQIQWDHNGQDHAAFRLWCNGAILKNYAPAELVKSATAQPDGTFTYTATAPGLPIGEHACFVSAYNLVEETLGEAKGEPAVVTVATTTPSGNKLPAVPVRFKILVTIGG